MSDVITASSTAQQQSIKTDGRKIFGSKIFSSKIFGDKTKVADLQLEVVAGVHRGVALTLDKADYRIGCSHQTDIVLSDHGIAPEHAVLHDEGATVRIDATGGEVGVERKRIPMGYGCRVRLPTDIVLGTARLHLSRPTNARPASVEFSADGAGQLLATTGRLLINKLLTNKPINKLLANKPINKLLANKPITIAGTLICFALVATAIAVDQPQLAQISIAHAKTNDAKISQTNANVVGIGKIAVDQGITSTAAPSIREHSSDNQSVAEAAQNLSKRLDAAKIQTLRVSTVDGRLVVSGALTKPQALEWAVIQKWFDQTYGSHIVLNANVTDVDGRANPRLQLQAIWYGDQPYIITAEGEHYYQGAILDNGWTVREIAADHLLLAKDGDTVTLTY